jgi:hypothetical protein
MKAWYFIGIVTALIPLYFRIRGRLGSAAPGGTANLADDKLRAGRRVMLLVLLGALGAMVLAWSVAPPL